jgi:hypothetical protein
MAFNKIAAIKRTELFEELEENTLRVVAERACERRFQKGEVLFVTGEETLSRYLENRVCK